MGPLPFVITSIASAQMEGWYEALDPATGEYDCEACRFSGQTKRHPFVWFPE
jgi:hypothetical protein